LDHRSSPPDTPSNPFLVDTALTPLTVTVEEDAVSEIRFGRHARRPPATPFEHLVADELLQYGAGTRTAFTFRLAPRGTPFRRRVWEALRQIPYGETRTYGEIAAAVGKSGAARAVGTANHHNPIPVVIPCHRVVGSGGRLCGFGGGLDLKRRLLELEAAHSPLRLTQAR
jgi:methylated-DNA-[protein]-cysteine S-methyltransferase